MQVQIESENYGLHKNCATAAEALELIGRFVRDSTVSVTVQIEAGDEERGGAEDSGF